MRKDRDETFEQMYRRFYTRMLRFFIRLHFSPEDAEELTQETFVRFLRAIEDYRGDAEWAFLEETARNVAINRYRSRSTQKRAGQTVPIDDAVLTERRELTDRPDYVNLIEEKRQRERLYAEIAKLPRRQKRCLMPWLQGETYQQIARLERTSVDAVKSAIRDAKKELRARLGDDNVDLPEDDQ